MFVRFTQCLLTAVVVGSVFFALGTFQADAQGVEDDTTPGIPGDALTVVMTEIEPFVIDDDGDPDGLYVEIWEETAAELGVSYEVIWADSFGEMLASITDGEAQVAVAPLAPTAEREAIYDFTSAVISSGPQLGYHERISSRGGLLRALFSRSVLNILGIAMVGLILLAHLIWLVERNEQGRDGDFAETYVHGIWDGFWWATVTVTTVGYGDKAPRSVRGRAVALLAMLLSLFLVGAFVSQVTEVLQQQVGAPFTGFDDLEGRKVGVVADSSFADFMDSQGASTVGYPSQLEVFEAAEAGEIDVLIANPYAMNVLGSDYGVSAVGDVLYQEFETFGLAQDSPWREPINQVLADLQASGEVEQIVERWLD